MQLINHIQRYLKKVFLPRITVRLKEYFEFFKACMAHKKIVVISEKRILSLPVSAPFQAAITSLCLVLLLWFSYSTGQYFSYESVINQKEKEIWSSNMLNQNLQHQVMDLHENLKELNRYFVTAHQLNLEQENGDSIISKKKSRKTTDNDFSSLGAASPQAKPGSQSPETETQRVLFNIRDKVLERIDSLEGIINLTGVRLKNILANNRYLETIYYSAHVGNGNDPKHQGGPFEPTVDDDGPELVFDREMFMQSVLYLKELEQAVHAMPLTYPMDKYYLSSGFGKRRDPFRNRLAMHKGLDFVGKRNSQVYATASGVIAKARRYGAYGNFIEIDHGNGFTTRYGHLNRIMVQKGQEIIRGETIGLQGNTGRSSGDHLHYEVRFNKRAYNPMKFLKAGHYVF
jgi:murein DD-endopeptidase MepM/ murein hydrolase activator NlpD